MVRCSGGSLGTFSDCFYFLIEIGTEVSENGGRCWRFEGSEGYQKQLSKRGQVKGLGNIASFMMSLK